MDKEYIKPEVFIPRNTLQVIRKAKRVFVWAHCYGDFDRVTDGEYFQVVKSYFLKQVREKARELTPHITVSKDGNDVYFN